MIKTGERTLMVDPPEGWRYGFPAELGDGQTLEELFVKHNYPEEMRELGHKYSRYWYA